MKEYFFNDSMLCGRSFKIEHANKNAVFRHTSTQYRTQLIVKITFFCLQYV